jgi:16S rRNA pseudouridine516 synthase
MYRPCAASQVERFASGALLLRGEDAPCLPARLEFVSEAEAVAEVREGRYHQVRRMFAACGHSVLALHRERFGMLGLGDLAQGEYRHVVPSDVVEGMNESGMLLTA